MHQMIDSACRKYFEFLAVLLSSTNRLTLNIACQNLCFAFRTQRYILDTLNSSHPWAKRGWKTSASSWETRPAVKPAWFLLKMKIDLLREYEMVTASSFGDAVGCQGVALMFSTVALGDTALSPDDSSSSQREGLSRSSCLIRLPLCRSRGNPWRSK